MTDLPTVGDQPAPAAARQGLRRHGRRDAHLSSPPVSDFEVERRAEVIAAPVSRRPATPGGQVPARPPVSAASWSIPRRSRPALVERLARSLLQRLAERGLVEDGQYVAILGAGVIDFRLAAGCRRGSRPRTSSAAGRAEPSAPAWATPTSGPACSSGPLASSLGELKRRCQARAGRGRPVQLRGAAPVRRP